MEEKEIISGATLQVNFASLGYEAVATLLISVEAHHLGPAMEQIDRIKEVHAYRHFNTAYNVRGVTVLKDLSELNQVKEILRKNLPTLGLKTYIWTGIRNIPQNLKLNPNEEIFKQHNKTSPIPFQERTEAKVDKLDLEIINRLTSNGKAPFNQIANEIGTSTDTVVKRYHRLKENGVIKVTIQVNLNILGYQALLDFNIACISSLSVHGIIESLENIPNVVVITKTSGDYDLQVTAAIRDVEEMFVLQGEIAKIRGITKIETSARRIATAWPAPLHHMSTF
jgi:Lrp/AsnC family transcriptional regulator for asnA, asnC and gidA